MTQGLIWALAASMTLGIILGWAPRRLRIDRTSALASFGLIGAGMIVGARVGWWIMRLMVGGGSDVAALFSVHGGFSSLSGALGATGVVLGLGSMHRRPGEWLDFFAPLGLLALSIARLGCHVSGCDFGGVVASHSLFSIFAVSHGPASDASLYFASLGLDEMPPLYPFALSMSILTALLVSSLVILSRFLPLAPGRLAGLVVSGYALLRIVMEELRHPITAPEVAFGFNLNQWSALMALVAGALFVSRRGMGQKRQKEQ